MSSDDRSGSYPTSRTTLRSLRRPDDRCNWPRTGTPVPEKTSTGPNSRPWSSRSQPRSYPKEVLGAGDPPAPGRHQYRAADALQFEVDDGTGAARDAIAVPLEGLLQQVGELGPRHRAKVLRGVEQARRARRLALAPGRHERDDAERKRRQRTGDSVFRRWQCHRQHCESGGDASGAQENSCPPPPGRTLGRVLRRGVAAAELPQQELVQHCEGDVGLVASGTVLRAREAGELTPLWRQCCGDVVGIGQRAHGFQRTGHHQHRARAACQARSGSRFIVCCSPPTEANRMASLNTVRCRLSSPAGQVLQRWRHQRW